MVIHWNISDAESINKVTSSSQQNMHVLGWCLGAIGAVWTVFTPRPKLGSITLNEIIDPAEDWKYRSPLKRYKRKSFRGHKVMYFNHLPLRTTWWLPSKCRLDRWQGHLRIWPVVYLPLWKIMEWKSVGMIVPFPTGWKVIKFYGSKPPTSMYIYIYYHPIYTPSGKIT